jgi:hypothetical protein
MIVVPSRGPQPPAGGPTDRGDQLADGVLGGDRVLQDGGVQHPPVLPEKHPGLLHHLADRLQDPLWPGEVRMRLRQYTSTVGWKPSSSRRNPQATFQTISRRSALMASRSLGPSGAWSTITVATTSAGTDGWPPPCRTILANSSDGSSWWRWSAEKRTATVRNQVAAPAGRVHLGVGAMTCRADEPAVCPLSAPSANHRIDPTSQVDHND